jgi:hypothetical protein
VPDCNVVINHVDLGELLTLYHHLQDEDDFLIWLQSQLAKAEPTLLDLAKLLHQLYSVALTKTCAWSYMTEVAPLWDNLGEERQAFFLQYAREMRGTSEGNEEP